MKRVSGRLITLGSFDGVHRGHGALIDRVVAEAKKRRAKAVALTFGLPPRMVLDRSHEISILSDEVEKRALLKWKGLHEVIVQEFNGQFSKIKPYSFFRDILLKKYRAKGLVVGLDFRFGVNRSAGVMELVRWGQEKRIPVWVIPPVKFQGKVVSSTEVRKLFSENHYDAAIKFLDHAYLIHGKIRKGRGIGRQIGFPTSNLQVSQGKVLPRGVFAVVGRRWGRQKGALMTGVCNIGTRPTFFKKSGVTVEVHWLTGRPPEAPSSLLIELVGRIRSEKRFESPAALSRAIAADIRRAVEILSPAKRNSLILRSI